MAGTATENEWRCKYSSRLPDGSTYDTTVQRGRNDNRAHEDTLRSGSHPGVREHSDGFARTWPADSSVRHDHGSR